MAHPGGRPPKFSNKDELREVFEQWKAEFNLGGAKFGEIPDIEGFCDYIDAWRDLLNEYEKKPEFSVTVKKIKNWIYYRKKQLAMANRMNATVFIFDAKNNFGYADKTEQDIKLDVPQPILGGITNVYRDNSPSQAAETDEEN